MHKQAQTHPKVRKHNLPNHIRLSQHIVCQQIYEIIDWRSVDLEIVEVLVTTTAL